MRRLSAVLVLAIAAVPAAFAGPPRILRHATVADASPKPPLLNEFWDLYLSRPGTRQFAELGIHVQRSLTGDFSGAQAGFGWYRRPPRLAITGTNDLDMQVPQSAPGLGLRDDYGHNASLAYARGRWTVDALLQSARVHLVLSQPHAGETALQWPVGTETGPGQPSYAATFNWSSVVGLARADGWMGLKTSRVRISGWRASLVHIWARWSFADSLMQHRDAVIIHDSSGAWFVEGWEKNPGGDSYLTVHDARWSGVLVHVTVGGVTACRAHVRRTHLRQFFNTGDTYFYPTALAATCGGLHLAVRLVNSLSESNDGTVRLFVRSSSGGYGTFEDVTDNPFY